MTLAFGLNRWDWSNPMAFAAQVAEAERRGLDWCFLPVNPLAVPDPYVLLAAAAGATSEMRFGPLLETPRLRSPAVAAGSIASLDEVSKGRTMLTYGIGDTAVRDLGERPATVAELEEATVMTRSLLSGDRLDVGTARPARLRHARPVPVWIAAGGPRTLRMAGRVADGVFIRAGLHPDVLRETVAAIRTGAIEAGRHPEDVALGVIVHTIRSKDPARVRAISRAMAAGFFEYSPMLFEQAGLEWNGPPIRELAKRVLPDFHHASDLVAAGELVAFLDEEVARSFSFHGSDAHIADQIGDLRRAVPGVRILVPHPVPLPTGTDLSEYLAWLERVVFPLR